MGGAASITNAMEQELQKPLDGSDIADHQSGVNEVIRLRQLIHSYNSAPHSETNFSAANETELNSDNPATSEHHKDFHKILGVNDEEMKRNVATKKLGVTDADYKKANEIMLHNPIGLLPGPEHKQDMVLGYTDEQVKRGKAVKQLGTSESFMDRQRAEELGAIGADNNE
jgi:hypothetical protein